MLKFAKLKPSRAITMNHFKAKILSLLLCCANLNVAHAADKLIFALDLIRHGDRTPAFNMPKSTYKWPQGMGELTPKGMEQEFNLGQSMRQRYITGYHLLPEHYDSSTLYVRSSDFNRTLMSAESFLFGLYPPGTGSTTLPGEFQPIPIHTLPKEIDNLLIPNFNQAKYDEVMAAYVFTQPDWQALTVKLQPQFAHWEQVTGMPVKNLQDVLYVADWLFISKIYNVPAPAGLNEQDQKDIMEAGAWAFQAEMKIPQIVTLTGARLLATISHYLHTGQEQTTKLKYVLLSGHDSSIMSVLSAMQAPVSTWPPYASDVNFLLFETPDKKYYVKISYNNQPVKIPACGGAICSLEQLDKLAD
jgi:hypothetical protein